LEDLGFEKKQHLFLVGEPIIENCAESDENSLRDPNVAIVDDSEDEILYTDPVLLPRKLQETISKLNSAEEFEFFKEPSLKEAFNVWTSAVTIEFAPLVDSEHGSMHRGTSSIGSHRDSSYSSILRKAQTVKILKSTGDLEISIPKRRNTERVHRETRDLESRVRSPRFNARKPRVSSTNPKLATVNDASEENVGKPIVHGILKTELI
jgi:hypothetical protein